LLFSRIAPLRSSVKEIDQPAYPYDGIKPVEFLRRVAYGQVDTKGNDEDKDVIDEEIHFLGFGG
jgi:hypothetical protein